MKKEPVILYLIRLLISFAAIALLAMLYWSSLLIEQDVKQTQIEIYKIKEEISNLRTTISKVSSATITAKTINKEPPSSKNKTTIDVKKRPHIDPQLPNLLVDDPFYEKTLPHMLGVNFQPHGIRHTATYGKPKNLHPFANFAEVSGWMSLCSGSVAANQFGKYETFAPDLAIKMEERKNATTGTPEYWIHLRDDIFWKPLHDELFSENLHLAPHFLKKHPVTAHDFKFFFDAVMNPFVQEGSAVVLRNYLGDVEEFRVIDDLTFVIRWKTQMVKQPDGTEVPKVKYMAKLWTGQMTPLASFVYKYFPDGTKIVVEDQNPETYRTNSVWAQNFTEHWAKNIIVSCGPWSFDGMTERQITFTRNTDYYEPLAALIDSLEVAFKESPNTIWQDFKIGNLDSYALIPAQLIEWKQFSESPEYAKQAQEGKAIKRLDYLLRNFNFIAWNSQKSFFQNKMVRRALTMAIDRQRIINNLLNGLAVEISGPFFVQSENNNPSISPWPFDPQAAKRLLEEEGWYDRNGDGILDHDNSGTLTPFRFKLMYYVKNPTSQAICSYVSTALKEIGVDCTPYGVDVADLSSAIDEKSFDALFFGWQLGSPPEDPKQIWHSSGAKERGSSNFVGFANPEADKLIDALQYEYNKEARRNMYFRLHAIFHDEQPYTFLYSPKTALLYREYLQNVFIPAQRQDLIPGANMEQPQPSIFWLKE